MKIYTCTQFAGHWPVGCAAVVAAYDAQAAAYYLRVRLAERGLDQHIDPAVMREFDINAGNCELLLAGNY